MTRTRLSGNCLCGAVRFTASPVEMNYQACHCSYCRRWAAGPFLGVQVGGTLEVADGAPLGTYRSSDWAERQFCLRCGSPLFYKLVGYEHCVVAVEAFDDTSSFTFAKQIFVDEKPAHYSFANRTAMQTGAEVFAAFKASREGGVHV